MPIDVFSSQEEVVSYRSEYRYTDPRSRLLELHAYPLSDANSGWLDLHQVAHKMRSLIELDDGDDIRNILLEGSARSTMNYRIGVDRPIA